MIEWCLQEHSVGAFCRSMRRRFHKGDSRCSVGRLFCCALFICTAFFCDFSILATNDNTCDTDHNSNYSGNRTEAYKTDEQRYSEEQDAIDRETKKKLREMEQEEKMQKLPSTAPEEIKTIRVSQDKFEEYTGEYRKPYMITKDDGFKVGNVVKLVVFAAGKATGETADMRITCKDDDITCSGLSDGWCVIGLGEA